MRSEEVGRQARIWGFQALAVGVLLLVQSGLRVGAFTSVYRVVETVPAIQVRSSKPAPAAVAQRIDRTDRRLLGPRSCLVRALCVQALCRLFGHDSTFRLGVRTRSPTIEAHAWVEHRGDVIIGGNPRREFVPFSPFENR